MRHIVYIALAAVVALLSPLDIASAKTCKCEQHKAEATAESSCSRTESTDYCTISFSSSANSDAPNFDRLLEQLPKTQPLEFADWKFAAQNMGDYPAKPVGGATLTSVALWAIPEENLQSVAGDFSALFEAGSSSLEGLVADFNEDGCVQAERGNFKVLIIAWSSDKNGTCKE